MKEQFKDNYYYIINEEIKYLMTITSFEIFPKHGEIVYQEIYDIFHKLYRLEHKRFYTKNDILIAYVLIRTNIELINDVIDDIFKKDILDIYKIIVNIFKKIIDLCNKYEFYEMSNNITEINNSFNNEFIKIKI